MSDLFLKANVSESDHHLCHKQVDPSALGLKLLCNYSLVLSKVTQLHTLSQSLSTSLFLSQILISVHSLITLYFLFVAVTATDINTPCLTHGVSSSTNFLGKNITLLIQKHNLVVTPGYYSALSGNPLPL